jgi:hypothetical protein
LRSSTRLAGRCGVQPRASSRRQACTDARPPVAPPRLRSALSPTAAPPAGDAARSSPGQASLRLDVPRRNVHTKYPSVSLYYVILLKTASDCRPKAPHRQPHSLPKSSGPSRNSPLLSV